MVSEQAVSLVVTGSMLAGGVLGYIFATLQSLSKVLEAQHAEKRERDLQHELAEALASITRDQAEEDEDPKEEPQESSQTAIRARKRTEAP